MEGHDGIKVTMIERGMEAVIFQGAMEKLLKTLLIVSSIGTTPVVPLTLPGLSCGLDGKV